MRLNIKSDEACRLAQELAQLTGERITDAVIEALRDRLEKIRHQQTVSLSERLLAIGRDCASRLKRAKTGDHGTLLYDKRGLPR